MYFCKQNEQQLFIVSGAELNNSTRPPVKYRVNVGWYLIFENAQPSDSGMYICSNNKNEFKSFHLTVEGKNVSRK